MRVIHKIKTAVGRKAGIAGKKTVGKDALFLISATAPLVLLQLGYAVLYTARLDAYALSTMRDTVSLLFENVLMSLLISVGGSLLLDLAEREAETSEKE
ncbi:MAG: hypothetical protein KBS76_07820 [Ruminococcus sp.]|nr:hypothetical protein [Candidatus Apopatosoma intestinale]